jgi:hypothetical protein
VKVRTDVRVRNFGKESKGRGAVEEIKTLSAWGIAF